MTKISRQLLWAVGVLLMLHVAFHATQDVSTGAAILVCIGSLICIPLPMILAEIFIEIARSAWQSWRIAGWLSTDTAMNFARSRGFSPKKMSRARRALLLFKREFFASYTTVEVSGRTFYFHPSRETAYFEERDREDDDYLTA